MGKIKFILLGGFVLIAISCNGLFGVDNNVGNPIKFGTRAYPTTRTFYNDETSTDVRLQWSEGDQVSIYMGWEGGQVLENADYSVNLDYNSGRESYGSLEPLGESLKWHGYFKDGRAWEYNHTFYSAYPPRAFDGNGFEFDLDSDQTYIGMECAYMVAYEKDVNSNGGYVELHYYPMITTLCVTIDNDANFPIGNILKLCSGDRAIAGSYRADIDKYDNWAVGGGNITSISSDFSVRNPVTFFIIPRAYRPNELYFSIEGLDDKLIPVSLEPYYKYNITIKTAEKEPEIEEPAMDVVVAQIILSYLRKLGNQGYNQFKSFFETYFDYIEKDYKQGQNYFDEGWYKQLQNGFTEAQKNNNWSKLLSDLFAVPPAVKDGALNEILRLIAQNTTELVITEGDYKITNDFNEKTNLSDYFPNLTSIKLIVQEPRTIYLTGFKYLTYVEFDGGSNGDVTLIITGNEKNVTVKKGNNHKVSVNGTQITNNNELIVPAQ